jgi:uncharacterized GH25 family protein
VIRLRFLPIFTLAILAQPLFTAGIATAHDYWLSPGSFALELGDTCTVHLLVGDRLEPEIERPFQKNITTRYEWLARSTSRDLRNVFPDSTLPVLRLPVEKEETVLLVMDRDFVVVETTYGRFREFLEHEENGALLTEVSTESDDTPMRRRYARNLKALLNLASRDSEGLHDHKVDQTLEILLLQDPLELKVGDSLEIKVLFEGEPLQHELVRFFVGGENELVTAETTRTNRAGVASIRVDHAGLYVVRVGHVKRCEGCDEADWDTYYATFSFVYSGPAVRQ